MSENNTPKTANGFAEYRFNCPDGSAVFFSPFLENRICLVAGIGPSNTGKTNLRKQLQAHYTRSGVMCRFIGGQTVIADDKQMLKATLEAFCQVVKEPGNRALKYFDIDEAGRFSGNEPVRAFVSQAVRCWRPFGAGLGLWGQDPCALQQFLNGFEGDITTLFFFAAPAAGALHKKIFGLGDDELAAIKSLKPRSEAYLIQRETGISKKILVDCHG